MCEVIETLAEKRIRKLSEAFKKNIEQVSLFIARQEESDIVLEIHAIKAARAILWDNLFHLIPELNDQLIE